MFTLTLCSSNLILGIAAGYDTRTYVPFPVPGKQSLPGLIEQVRRKGTRTRKYPPLCSLSVLTCHDEKDLALYMICFVAPLVIQPLINVLTIRSWWDLHNGTPTPVSDPRYFLH